MASDNHWRAFLDLAAAYEDKGFLKKFQTPARKFRGAFYSLLTLLSKTLFRVKVDGLANLPEHGPYIIAANHCSAADYPLIAWALPEKARDNLYAVTTAYFYDNPFTRPFILTVTNSVRIDTERDFIPALRASARVLAQGGSLYINPEGTWSESGELLPFKVGVGLLSFELAVPIVPVHIGGTHEFLPAHALLPRQLGRITISFGQPIYPEKYKEFVGREEDYYVYKRITDDLREEMINLRDKKTRL